MIINYPIELKNKDKFLSELSKTGKFYIEDAGNGEAIIKTPASGWNDFWSRNWLLQILKGKNKVFYIYELNLKLIYDYDTLITFLQLLKKYSKDEKGVKE